MPPSYLTRAALAAELMISESTVDEMVRRGVLPRPLKLSPGCVRWRWADVDMALASLGSAVGDAAAEEAAGIRRAIEAAGSKNFPAADGSAERGRRVIEASRRKNRPAR